MGEIRTIYGVDFSGAKDAGNKIWISRGAPDGKGLLIQECFRARDLPNSGRALKVCLPALVNLIKSNRNAAFGFDFPFGLPIPLVEENIWDGFVLAFPARFKKPDDFKKKCFSVSGDQELKRRTDREAHAPFSPYNLRLYKQTYYGISNILLPLVRHRSACVVPFHRPITGKPWVLEICPASTLKFLGLYGFPYKGRDKTHKNNRWKILQHIKRIGSVKTEPDDINQKIIEDKGGDALDSVIAAMATFNAIQNKNGLIPDDNDCWKIEGWVYPMLM